MSECQSHVIDLRFPVDGIGRTGLSTDAAQQAMGRYFRHERLAQARLEVVEAA
jgi:hypothetical protein